MRRLLLAACLFLLAAAPPVEQHIDGSVPMFCRDSTGVFQPFQRADFSRLQEGFQRQFGWTHSLRSTSGRMGVLTFAADPRGRGGERITYDVTPYNGGIALLHMHVRLRGVTEDVSGTSMCGRTFGIVNAG